MHAFGPYYIPKDSEIHHLDIRFMVNTGDKATFHFHKLHKSWRKGKSPPSLAVHAYSSDKQLCVAQTKKRKDPSRTQFLLSYRKRYKEIASSTVSGRIKKLLEFGNLDTNIFKRYSTISASTSKINLKRLALSDISYKESRLSINLAKVL